jgi:hypothetical protein
MESSGLVRKFVAAVALLTVAVVSCGCPATDESAPGSKQQAAPAKAPEAAAPAKATEKPAADASKPSADSSEEASEAPKPPDLGPPLVDNMADLGKQLDPNSPVWIDKKEKQVVLVGQTCKATYLLEFFATYRGKDYESVVVVDAKPSIVHAALLALGAAPGHPVRFQPKYVPPSGTELLIEVRWKDKDGKVQSAPAQKWVRNVQTKKALDVNWVFAGSTMYKDPETGKESYLGDRGDFICLLNLPTATIDLPTRSTGGLDDRMYEGFVENMPPAKTPVTILIKPVLAKKP